MTKAQRRLARIIRNFRGRTIGVLGDFVLDEMLRGEATRISPEAPVPVVLMRDPRRTEVFPGGAGNVAANIAALGGRALPFGAIGTDRTGRQLRARLERRRISCGTLVEVEGRVTPRKVRIVAQQHQLLRLDFERPAPISSRIAGLVLRHIRASIGQVEGLIISDYEKGSVTAELSKQVMSLAIERRLPVFVDPKPGHAEIGRGATAITPNLHEAEAMAGLPLKDRGQLEAGGRRLLAELGCRYLLITRGSEGMTLFEAPRPGSARVRVHEVRSVPRPVYDVTGAGDTVIAVLALACCAGASMKEAAELANLAAGRVVLKFGTAEVTSQELLEAVAGLGKAEIVLPVAPASREGGG
jgi:rfaE bifunctional protein kinase chain/domain